MKVSYQQSYIPLGNRITQNNYFGVRLRYFKCSYNQIIIIIKNIPMVVFKIKAFDLLVTAFVESTVSQHPSQLHKNRTMS